MGEGQRSFLRDPTPADPKGPPIVLFWDIHFWRTDPKICLKAPLMPKFTNFVGEARSENNSIFRSKFFKSVQKRLLNLFFPKFYLRRRKICQKRAFLVLWESSKNRFSQPTKSRHHFQKFIENPPLLKKVLNTPLLKVFLTWQIHYNFSLNWTNLIKLKLPYIIWKQEETTELNLYGLV